MLGSYSLNSKVEFQYNANCECKVKFYIKNHKKLKKMQKI